MHYDIQNYFKKSLGSLIVYNNFKIFVTEFLKIMNLNLNIFFYGIIHTIWINI